MPADDKMRVDFKLKVSTNGWHCGYCDHEHHYPVGRGLPFRSQNGVTLLTCECCGIVLGHGASMPPASAWWHLMQEPTHRKPDSRIELVLITL